MRSRNYFTHIIETSYSKVMIVFVIGYDSIYGKDLNDVFEIASKLGLNRGEVIIDMFWRNGHSHYSENRMFLVDTKNQYKDLSNLTDLYGAGEQEEIVRKCNEWWFANIELLQDLHQKWIIESVNKNFNVKWS